MRIAALPNPLSGLSPELDPQYDALRASLGAEGEVIDAHTPESLRDAARRCLEEGFDAVAVTNGDNGLSAALTALIHHAQAHSDTLDRLPMLVPLGESGLRLVADALNLPGGPAAEALTTLLKLKDGRGRGLFGKHQELKQTTHRTLRLMDAALPNARYGFTFGAGAMYTALEQEQRRGGKSRRGLRAALRSVTGSLLTGKGAWGAVKARILVDEVPLAPEMRMIGASTLASLPMGLKPFHAPINDEDALHLMWHNMNAATTAAVALPLARGQLKHPQHRILKARRVLLDMSAGHVLDGALQPPTAQRIIKLEPGPIVSLLSLA